MNYRSAKFPSLHYGKEGWLRQKSNVAKPPFLAQTGWFSLGVSIGKPPRPRGQRRLRDIFLIARPPLLAVMQGGDFCTPAIIHIFVDRPYVGVSTGNMSDAAFARFSLRPSTLHASTSDVTQRAVPPTMNAITTMSQSGR